MQLQGANSQVLDLINVTQTRLQLELHRQPLNVTVVDMKPSGTSCIRVQILDINIGTQQVTLQMTVSQLLTVTMCR